MTFHIVRVPPEKSPETAILFYESAQQTKPTRRHDFYSFRPHLMHRKETSRIAFILQSDIWRT